MESEADKYTPHSHMPLTQHEPLQRSTNPSPSFLLRFLIGLSFSHHKTARTPRTPTPIPATTLAAAACCAVGVGAGVGGAGTFVGGLMAPIPVLVVAFLTVTVLVCVFGGGGFFGDVVFGGGGALGDVAFGVVVLVTVLFFGSMGDSTLVFPITMLVIFATKPCVVVVTFHVEAGWVLVMVFFIVVRPEDVLTTVLERVFQTDATLVDVLVMVVPGVKRVTVLTLG